jgi:O-antigen/teichoic acid export membrane protein
MSVGAGVVTLVFFVVGRWALGTFFGAEFADAQPLLIVLCLAQLVAGLFGPCTTVMIMIGRERIVAVSYFASVVSSIAVAAVLIPRFGAIGAAFAYLLGNVIRGSILNVYASRSGLNLSLFSLARLPSLLRH